MTDEQAQGTQAAPEKAQALNNTTVALMMAASRVSAWQDTYKVSAMWYFDSDGLCLMVTDAEGGLRHLTTWADLHSVHGLQAVDDLLRGMEQNMLESLGLA